MAAKLIYEHLQSSTELASYLAVYDGKPAVFQDGAPEDTDPAWAEGSHYGQVILHLEQREDWQRRGRRRLVAEILTEPGSRDGIPLMEAVRQRLNGWFFAGQEQVFSIRWTTARKRAAADGTADRIVMRFQLTSYPDQSILPDSPAAVLGAWSKERLAQVIGRSFYLLGRDDVALPQAFKPTEQKPAVYWRLAKTAKCGWASGSKGAAWRSAAVQCHVMIPDGEAEAGAMAFLIEQALLREGRAEDGENFVLIGAEQGLDLTADPARTGQLTVEAVYPLTAETAGAEKLRHASVTMKERE